MTAGTNDDIFPYLLAFILNTLFLINYALWAVMPPSQASALFMMGALTLTCLVMLGKKQLWPIFFFWIFLLLITLQTGTPAWDTRSIWMFHAKRIFFDATLYAALDGYSPWSHNAYPLLYPALAASFAKAVGLWNEVFPKSVISFLYIPPALILYKELRSSLGIAIFLLAAVLICGKLMYNGYADVIIAMYAAAIVLFSANLSLDNTRGGAIRFALLLTSLTVLALIKNEGIVLAIAIIATMCFLRREYWKIYLSTLTCAALFLFFTWKLPLMFAQVSTDLAQGNILGRIIERISRSEEALSILFAMFKNGALLPILLTGAVLFFRASRREYCVAICFVGLYSAALFAVYLSTPHQLDLHLLYSIDRTMLPINIVCLATLLKLLLDELERRSQGGSAATP